MAAKGPFTELLRASKRPLRELAYFLVVTIMAGSAYAMAFAAAMPAPLVLRAAGILITGYGLLVLLSGGLKGMRDESDGTLVMVRKSILIAAVCTALFAMVSVFLLRDQFTSVKTGEHRDFVGFVEYYWWVFLDTLPGLKASESLESALRPSGLLAGLVVVGFRALVLYGVLRSLRVWWARRSSRDGDFLTAPHSQIPAIAE